MRVYLLAGGGAVSCWFRLRLPTACAGKAHDIFTSSYDESLSEEENKAFAGATVGSQSKTTPFSRSIELTIKNPIVGVGPGMFAVAEAEDAQEQNIEEVWHETHNAYTQVSSEIGIPGQCSMWQGSLLRFDYCPAC